MKLTDEELLQELKERFLTKEKALEDYQKLIEELGRVNQKLTESEQLKSQFLSNIRNEINNPFASILGLSQQLTQLNAQPNVDDIKSIASLIYVETFDLNFQFNNIFAAADSEAGELDLYCSKITLNDFMVELVDHFTPMATQHNTILELSTTNTTGGGQHFCNDASKLQLIIGNLISNAIKFSHAEPSVNNKNKPVLIQYHLEGSMLRCKVTDQGIGIVPDTYQKMFDSFTQLNEGMTKNYRGHGLGLAVVKAVLDMMDGSIEASSNLDQGSTFFVNIPEMTDQQAAPLSTAGNEFLFDDGEVF